MLCVPYAWSRRLGNRKRASFPYDRRMLAGGSELGVRLLGVSAPRALHKNRALGRNVGAFKEQASCTKFFSPALFSHSSYFLTHTAELSIFARCNELTQSREFVAPVSMSAFGLFSSFRSDII
jgi:hypothetical protein